MRRQGFGQAVGFSPHKSSLNLGAGAHGREIWIIFFLFPWWACCFPFFQRGDARSDRGAPGSGARANSNFKIWEKDCVLKGLGQHPPECEKGGVYPGNLNSFHLREGARRGKKKKKTNGQKEKGKWGHGSHQNGFFYPRFLRTRKNGA